MGETRTDEQVIALLRVCKAVEDTVNEIGADGAPGGVLYAALMSTGMSLDQFEVIMGIMVEAGKVSKRGQCYYPAGAKLRR